GTGTAGKPLGEGTAGAAPVPHHLPRGPAATSLPGPHHLHPGSGPRTDLRPLRGCRRHRDPAVPRPCGAAALLLEWFGGDAARAGRLLRPALQHPLHGAGESRPGQFPGCAVMRASRLRGKLRSLAVGAIAMAPALLYAAPPVGTRISFVSCPIVRDTRSVPCWLSDHAGTRYYLTIQSDVSAEVQPPMLGHQVLVEGVVTAEPAICGGVVLSSVRLSVMPERDANCNTMLPADDRYTIDFNPRPPGPSGGRLALDPAPRGSAAPPPPPKGPQSIDLHFDFDRAVSFRHPAQLMTVLDTARQVGA